MNKNKPSSIVAVFDFDHTLTDRDSLLAFLLYCQSYWALFTKFFGLIPQFIQYSLKKISRQQMKEEIISVFFRGLPYGDLQKLGKRYADKQIDFFLKPEALKKLQWHQSMGHRCLIVSASPDFYLIPWAARHGFENVLASRLELTPDGLVTGKLAGLNCWGPEKVYRLLSYLGPKENFQLYAYGDSLGDRELLEMADYPFYRKF